jgi:TetR/AcrR family transcriptional regulator, regulator of cefoperazone and chloramphenicol sensitivity
MTRIYTQRLRADKFAQTRTRILVAARELLPEADGIKVEEIARRAGVSVPTLYSHFGSKVGLLSALVGEIEKEAGLFVSFERVWRCHDGEAALRTMLEATLRFWQQAWTFVDFGLRVRRADPELGARFDRLDRSRLGHLVVICRRLRDERRLRAGVTPARAARLAFALTTPYVYEALALQGGVSALAARRLVVDAAVDAVILPGTNPAPSAVIDWATLGLKPPVV